MDPELPEPGDRALAEVNGVLVTTASRSHGAPSCPDLDLRAAAAAGAPEPAARLFSPTGRLPDAPDAAGGGPGARLPALLRHLLRPAAPLAAAAAALGELAGGAPPRAAPQLLAWHPAEPQLAAADAASGAVLVFDLRDALPVLGAPPRGSGGGGGAPPPPPPRLALRSPLARAPSALAWRPCAGTSVAVGCAGGVALWRCAGGAPRAGAPPPAADLTWLPAPAGAFGGAAGAPTSLAWQPGGRLLAAAAAAAPGLVVYDAAAGGAVPLRADAGGAGLLRWSPCGAYLFVGSASGGGFRLWETAGWRSARWEAADFAAAAGGGGAAGAEPAGGSGAGRLVGAAWAPDGRSLLLAYDGGAAGPRLASLHLTGAPPSLEAHALPLPLPLPRAAARAAVAGAAWDARGARLALALAPRAGRAAAAAGVVALFDTRRDPVPAARFVGFARTHCAAGAAAGAGADGDWELVGRDGEAAEGAAPPAAGGGGAAEPAELAFAPVFGQGALLACRAGGAVALLPMYFHA